MALEVEYEDFAPEAMAVDADAADMINGDGCATAVADVAGVADATADDAAFDGERKEDEADNQEDTPTLAADASEADEMDIEERRRLAESQFDIEVSAAKEDHFSLAVKRSEFETELKDIKADEKAALRNLRNLIKRGPTYPQVKSKIEEAVAAGGEKSAIQVDDPKADDSWKQVPTSQIIDGIEGMGKKKAEALISLAPTLGDLEELRARASMVHKPFGSVLPRGVGGNLADEIENAIERFWVEKRKLEAAK